MKTATYIKTLEGWRSDARLFKLDPPLTWTEYGEDAESTTTYVVVSAVVADYSGAETYIFACDADGKNVDYGELDGSQQGTLSHEVALKGAGYEIAS